MEKKKQTTFVLLGILLIAIVITVGVTYAIWQITLQQSGTNIITTGCLNLTLTNNTEAVNLLNAYPMSDEEGKSGTPYTFTITNTCEAKTNYVINLETVSSGSKILPDEYVKVSLRNGETESFLSVLNSSHENTEKVIAEASKAYKLYQGSLGNNESVTYNLNLWMDYDTPAIDEVMNASYSGKIAVSATINQNNAVPRMMVAMDTDYSTHAGGGGYYYQINNNTYLNNGKYEYADIAKIVFQNTKSSLENVVETVDFSEAQDGSVMGYYVDSTPDASESEHFDRYFLYIQADGKIIVNPKASYYFMISTHAIVEVEGQENLDFSYVTDMSYMFSQTSSEFIKAFDFTKLDTSKVTNMQGMFDGTLVDTLDLSTFDTTNVTDMSGMFSNCANLTTLNISSFNTTNVTTMEQMFNTSLYYESDMYGLDWSSNKLTTITFGDGFVYKDGMNISKMFHSNTTVRPTQSSWSSVTW